MRCFATDLSRRRSATMGASWFKRTRQFKSPLRVVAGFLLRSRETQKQKTRFWQQECQELKKQLDQQAHQLEARDEEIAQLKRQLRQVQRQRDEAKTRAVLPDDPPVGTHGYGPRLVSLAMNLAKHVGLRGSERALKIFLIGWALSKRFPISPRSEIGCCGGESRPLRNPSNRPTIGFG